MMPLAMTTPEILAELESLGTEQNRKIYGRHGVTGKMSGVSYAHLDKLAKSLRKTASAELAVELWASGNHDARILASKLFRADWLTVKRVDGWVADVNCGVLSAALANEIGKSGWPGAVKAADRWLKAKPGKRPWVAFSGWYLVSALAVFDETVPDAWFEPLLDRVRDELPTASNSITQAMNDALIAIGSRTPALRTQAEEVARKIGKVEVDHGETSCRTPQAIPYLEKVWAHKEAKAAKTASSGT
jgi:3-methyladenine DNA glycosylase AlkD